MELRRRRSSPGCPPPRRRARVLPPPSRVTAEDILAPSAQPPQSSGSAVCEMAPSPPPALMDDAIGEILLRLPPADPACLVRASLVCKPWLRLLSDGDFLRRYRAFHKTPPMLGFFNQYLDCSTVRGFVPTTKASLPVPHMAPAGYTLDCRHGRVLLQASESKSSRLVVWDPITGEQQSFSSPVHPNNCFATAVLCASHGCDRLECCGGPFLVAIVGTDWQGRIGGTLGSVYSSETATWSTLVYVNPMAIINCATSSLLAGDTLYFTMEPGVGIIKYDLAEGVVSVINAMPAREGMCLATAEDGGLGVAALKGKSLHMWSWRNDPNGVGEWVQGRVIKLDVMIPMGASDPFTWPCVIGFAEGTGNIFIRSNDGAAFIVELRSGQTRKICKKGYVNGSILPFMSFYTPDLASASLQRSMRD